MSDTDPSGSRATTEASAWFARLKRRQVSLTDLDAFRAWRQTPANRAAYDTVDDAWRRAGTLGGQPAMRDAVDGALRRGARRRALRERRLAWVTGATVAGIVVASAAGGSWLYLQARPSFATGVGEQRLVRLADGSTVRLDTDSRIDVALSGRLRGITLERGQAFFDVAHDPARPFLVAAGLVTVRAVGTKFDVRADGAEPTVTLVEGVVEVTRRAAAPRLWTLRPGEQLIASAAAVPKPVNPEAATSWTTGRVVFENVPLSTAVAEINRYCVHKILLRAPAVAQTPVTGSFETGDADAFAAAESDLHGLRASKLADGTIALDPGASTTN